MTLKQATQKVTGVHGKDHVQLLTCSVDSVDIPSRSCMATPLNGTFDSFPAQLMAEIDDGLLIVPTQGSTVKVMFSDLNAPTVIQFSQIDQVFIVAGGSMFNIDNTGLKLNIPPTEDPVNYGGIIKLVDPANTDAGVLARLNKIEVDINNLKTDISTILSSATTLQSGLAALSGSSAPVVGSALSALFLPYITAIISNLTTYSGEELVQTERSFLENATVQHGDGS